jgi:hypothetical protein
LRHSNGIQPTDQAKDRPFIHDFFVILQDKSSSSIFAKEFRKSNISETQGCRHDLLSAVGYSPPPCTRYLGNPLVCMKTAQDSANLAALFLGIIGQVLQMNGALEVWQGRQPRTAGWIPVHHGIEYRNCASER